MTIAKHTIDFLSGLKKNNTKEWFQENREEFDQARANFTEVVHQIAKEVAGFDPRIKKALLDKKTVKIFRIYRDVRFSKNKTPYKVNFGGIISPGGMERGNPGYYVHVEPGNSFLAGGLHMPESKVLAKIRISIAKDDRELRKILADPAFKKTFGGLDSYNILKTVPQGYAKDHKAADLLKFKSYLVLKKLPDKEILAKDFEKKAVQTFKTLKPLNDYLAATQGS